MASLVGGPVLGIGLLVAGICGGAKFARSCKAGEIDRVRRTKFLSKSEYLIKKHSKESVLLFFEKNKVPALLPITLDLQTEPLQTLNFELSTNRAPQSNEFLYKTA